jgi:hypothetical protein
VVLGELRGGAACIAFKEAWSCCTSEVMHGVVFCSTQPDSLYNG